MALKIINYSILLAECLYLMNIINIYFCTFYKI